MKCPVSVCFDSSSATLTKLDSGSRDAGEGAEDREVGGGGAMRCSTRDEALIRTRGGRPRYRLARWSSGRKTLTCLFLQKSLKAELPIKLKTLALSHTHCLPQNEEDLSHRNFLTVVFVVLFT